MKERNMSTKRKNGCWPAFHQTISSSN